MKSKIYLSSPHLGGSEQSFVRDAFETNWVAPLGPNVDGFEKDLQAYCGIAYAAALSSGTAALHLALILAGVKPGDKVICQSMTFSASANPIKYLGADPVFIDSESETWNMDPNALEDALKKLTATGHKPKAIIPVHLYGMPAKMAEIKSIAKQYEVPIVEDAAEALGSLYKGEACGSLSEFGVLSFNGNKIITTSGGGALLSNSRETIEKARFLATQARDDAPHYQHSEVGYNYRMSNICAGIGRGQMEVIDERVAQRRSNFERYKTYFQKWNERGYQISFQEEPEGSFSNRWLTSILIDPKTNNGLDREKIRLALGQENIEGRPLWKPMHVQPVFHGAQFFGGKHAESLFSNGLCLPSGSNLGDEEFERIFECLSRIFNQTRNGI